MRPTKLTMSAFGPFSGCEVIDFTELKDKNIFLITGPTGAGKTTIFDAISYALFGEASGESRSKDGLRSDFAEEATQTFVELEFELKGEIYTINRYPEQYRKKSRGEGYALKTAEAELILPENKVLTKIKNVDDKINELLGINKQQFKQIVMLAQGEFKKLLETESKEREIIFRRIFGTEAFEDIQRRLNEEKLELNRNISDKVKERGAFIKQISAAEEENLTTLLAAEEYNVTEIIEETEALVVKDEAKGLSIVEALNSKKLQQNQLSKALNDGMELNGKVQEMENLEKRAPEIDKLKVELSKARKALEVKIIDENRKQRQLSLTNKKMELDNILIRLGETSKLFEDSEKLLEKEQLRQGDVKEIGAKIAILNNFKVKVTSYETKVAGINTLKDNLKQRLQKKEELKEKLQKNRIDLDSLNKEYIKLKGLEIDRVQLEKDKEKNEVIKNETEDFLSDFKQYTDINKEQEKEKNLYLDFEKSYLSEKENYETQEDIFRKAQAGILAMGLKPGSPCPVCGSVEHPVPAEVKGSLPLSEEKLKQLKVKFENIAMDREKRLNKLTALETSRNEIKKHLGERATKIKAILGKEALELKGKDLYNYIFNKNIEIKGEIEKLQSNIEKIAKDIGFKPSLEKRIDEINIFIENNANNLENLEKEYTVAFGNLKSEEEQILTIEQDIPEELRSLQHLKTKVLQQEEQLNRLEEAYKKAQKNFNEASNSLTAVKVDKETCLKSIEEASTEFSIAEEKLNNALKAADFSNYEEYLSVLITEKEINNIEATITLYGQQYKSLKDSLERLSVANSDLRLVNLEELKAKLEAVINSIKEIEAEDKLIYARADNNKRALKEIYKINSIIEKDEKHYGLVADVAKMANGDNSERISFERYVLAAYFDEIIFAANLRLDKMTGGRFALKRIEEKGKGIKQQGLELEVFDNYTGKARHVTTLSGGESFKASLSMALGLADVVQSYAGGISLDTIFIDEGFGTLDPESLDNAIQCLFELQKGGRLVGVISHVAELKERIETRLEVTPAKEGSKVKILC